MLPKGHIDRYIMNPVTRRSIVIGGRVWKSLVRDKIIDPETNEMIEKKEEEKKVSFPELEKVEDIQEEDKEDEESDIEDPLENLVDKISEDTNEETAQLIANATDAVMKKHQESLIKIEDEEELFEEVKRLIVEELKSLI